MVERMFAVILVKRFTYRGVLEEWSNRYRFSTSPPADAAAWDAFLTALRDVEKTILDPNTKYVHAYGYADPDGHATRGLVLDPTLAPNAGSLPSLSGATVPGGDQAVCVRFRAGQNVKGRPRYLMKYFHGLRTLDGENVPTQHQGNIVTAMGKVRDGTLPGGAKLCAPDGTLAGVPEVIPFWTTRTLKRRGKRP